MISWRQHEFSPLFVIVALFGAMLGVFAHILTQEYYFEMMNYAISTVHSEGTIDYIGSQKLQEFCFMPFGAVLQKSGVEHDNNLITFMWRG